MALDERKGVWKSGRGKGRHTPKGRQVDDRAWEEVLDLLGDRPRRRDLLIEFLHLIQDQYGHLSAAHMCALAEEMRLSMAEVYEVATFYAHFDVVREDETPPPALTIRVCDSLTCEMFGAERLLSEIEAETGKEIRVVRAPCMGACDKAPVVAVGHGLVENADAAKVVAAGQAALRKEDLGDLAHPRSKNAVEQEADHEGAQQVDVARAVLQAREAVHHGLPGGALQ